MDPQLTEIILAIIALIAAGTITFRIIRKVKNSSIKTKQSKNIVFGDQAGRDIKKK